MTYYARTVFEDVPAGSTVFAFTFEYTVQSEVFVEVNGAPVTDFTFTSSHTIALNTPLQDTSRVVVFRSTDLTERAVDFQNGASLTENDLDVSAQQVFQAAQESLDNSFASVTAVEELTGRAERAADASEADAQRAYGYERKAFQHMEDAEDASDRSKASKDLSGSYAEQARVLSSAVAEDRSVVLSARTDVLTARNETLLSHEAFNVKVTRADDTLTEANTTADKALTISNTASATAIATEDRVSEYEKRLADVDVQTVPLLTAVADAQASQVAAASSEATSLQARGDAEAARDVSLASRDTAVGAATTATEQASAGATSAEASEASRQAAVIAQAAAEQAASDAQSVYDAVNPINYYTKADIQSTLDAQDQAIATAVSNAEQSLTESTNQMKADFDTTKADIETQVNESLEAITDNELYILAEVF